MNRKRALLLVAVILLLGRFYWVITRGNVVWQVHRHYPNAEVYLYPLNTPDPSWGELMRLTGVRFIARNEQVGIRVSDQTVNLDHFRGLKLNSITLLRCRVSDISVIIERWPAAAFTQCNLSGLPPNQARLLKPIAPYPDTYYLSGPLD